MMSMVERDRYSEEEDVTEENIIRTKRWFVILGDPGSGKTSFARWLVGKSIVDDSSISLDNLSCALQDYIKQGQALIILDGFDELPVSDQRSKIINLVENFVDTYVQTLMGTSAFDDQYLSRLFDDLSKSGGNQLIVTSRIVGYHVAPLAGQFAHYTIRPMDMEHMKDFVDYWFFRVHQRILDTFNLSLINQEENHASNSCLMSFICSVAFSQLEDSSLPTQRILLDEGNINSMSSLWSTKRSSISIRELIQIFSNIASYIHGNSSSESLSKNFNTKDHIRDIEHQACEFVQIIREDVGILAARGESLYGFLHLTFQEYFTCLKLINIETTKQEKEQTYTSSLQNKIQFIAQSVRYRTNDPHFQVPIALALGKISSSWCQKNFVNFCYEFIKEQDEYDSLLPLGAYMLIKCGNDLVNYPSHDVLFNALDRLIIAAGQHKWSIVCSFLFDQIIISLRKFRHDIVSLWIIKLLSQFYQHDIQTISALCHLIEGKPQEFENIKWLNQSSCAMLQFLSILDNENNEFAIDRLLVKIAFSNHHLLPVNPSSFKGFFLDEEIELNSISIILFSIIISLYGGLKRDGSDIVFDVFHTYPE
ncbi:unnamed protein product [Rotaria sp. Silwood1]|nr:unnamed protein product [Rotaria sp. Silwood1]CAF4668263.1 unnamed protein product [Rotaria sp. Silwood1]